MVLTGPAPCVSCRSGYESSSGLGPRYDPFLPTFWPARVPNHVLTERDYLTVNKESGRPTEDQRADAFANRASWLRGLHGTPIDQLTQGVAEWYKFGIVEVRPYTVGDGRYPDRLQVESVPGFPLEGVSDTANLVAIHVDAATAAEDAAVLAAAGDVLSLTGLAAEEVTVGYFDKLDPFRRDRGEPA
ncbi:hypothetical protein ACFYNO_26670 [Kitasatospora sp. NPDC006697]|uniref:hypothetical protein n=1 Tax=Kitasatospora sp. NPDC006697 TaxID=3364020 RepID=UPI00367BC02D